MNVAFFLDSYYPSVNGVITVVSQLKNEMEKMGNHAIIITVESRLRKDRSIKEKDIYRVPAIQVPLPKMNGMYFGFTNTRKIVKILKENDIQIIHSHTEFSLGKAAYRAAKKLNIPCVATTHTMWEDYYRHYFICGNLIPVGIIRSAQRQFYRNFDAMINVSQKAHDYFNLPYMLPYIHSEIIPNAIDEKKFCNICYTQTEIDELRKKFSIKKTDKILLYTGRIVEEKRIDELYAIVASIVKDRDDVKAIFVGSGLREEALKNKTLKDNLTDKIKFTGFVTWQEISEYYTIADIFITASLSEMHSMTILESLTVGKPVVCRRDTSFTDTIFHGIDGYLADSDEEMKSYIIRIVDDENLRKSMGLKALEISRRFVLKNQVLKHLDFYREVISRYWQSDILNLSFTEEKARNPQIFKNVAMTYKLKALRIKNDIITKTRHL